MSDITKLIEHLSRLATQYPDLPVSFQLPDGTEFKVDPENTPYPYYGVIVIPIAEVAP